MAYRRTKLSEENKRSVHCLELEVDEGLQIGSDELIYYENRNDCCKEHDPKGACGEPESIAAFEPRWQPMDQHADKEYYKDVAVGMYDLRYKLEVPLAANATDHVAGSLPSQLVSLGGRKIGTAAEKETCEGDKCESEENIPRPFESGF